MREGLRIAAGAVVAAAALAVGVYLGLPSADRPDPSAVSALTSAKLPDLAGVAGGFERWQGQVLVVNFWASWCPPCREEIPGLLRVQAKHAANGLQVVGIAVDSAANAQKAADQLQITYPVLVGGAEAVELVRRLGNRAGALPYTIVLDRSGAVVASHLGLISEAELERIVRPLLG